MTAPHKLHPQFCNKPQFSYGTGTAANQIIRALAYMYTRLHVYTLGGAGVIQFPGEAEAFHYHAVQRSVFAHSGQIDQGFFNAFIFKSNFQYCLAQRLGVDCPLKRKK